MKFKVKAILKGGPGSGHFDHAGRPGKVGGSQPSHYTGPASRYENEPIEQVGNLRIPKHVIAKDIDELSEVSHPSLGSTRPYWIAPDGTLISVLKFADKDEYIDHVLSAVELAKLNPEEYGEKVFQKFNPWVRKNKAWERTLELGFVRVDYNAVAKDRRGNTISRLVLTTYSLNKRMLRKLQGLVDSGKLPIVDTVVIGAVYDNTGKKASGSMETLDFAEFIDSEYVRWNDGNLSIKETYVELKQLPIDDAAKRRLFEIRLGVFYEQSDALAEQVFTGALDIGSWEAEMRTLIKEMYTSASAIGKGGWDNMTFSDWGRLGNPLKNQYKYLQGFASDIAERAEDVTLPYIRSRARMYGNSAGYVAQLMQAQPDLIQNLPWLPKDGSTECLVNCKCFWELAVIKKSKTTKTVRATWRLRPAEHCSDCVARNGYSTTFEVHIDTRVPPILGGF